MRLELDGLRFDGYPDVSPYSIDVEGIGTAGRANKRYTWSESAYSAPSLIRVAPSLLERTIPLMVRSRFTTAHVNLITDPIPQGGGSIWTAKGTITSIATDTDTLPPSGTTSVKVITNGNATTGGRVSFTATVAAYSAGIWVNAPAAAPMSVQFNGETATAFTGTGDWQLVKTENKTLTAATRYVEVTQTDTGSRTFYIANCVAVLAATAPNYFDGACGDGIWNGTAHASTSTAKTGADAVSRAIGALEEVGDKADDKSRSGGITGHWRPNNSTFDLTIDVLGAELVSDSLDYDRLVAHNNLARCEYKIYASPEAHGTEYTLATASKAGGPPALELELSSAKGDIKGPVRVLLNNTSATDQKMAVFGIHYRDYDSAASCIIRGSSLSVTGLGGTAVAGTDEVQTITTTGTPTGGTFTLTLDGKTTGTIAYNASAADVQTALRALANIGSAGVVCTGGPLPTGVVCTFSGAPLAATNVNAMTFTNSLTGGASPTPVITQTTTGVPAYANLASIGTSYSAICSTGNQTHVGDYRVLARVCDDAQPGSTSDGSRVRLSYATGDQPVWISNDAATPAAVGDYCWVALGSISIPPAQSGTQRWVGRIEAKTTGTAGTAFRVAEVVLIPLETGTGQVLADAGSSSSVLQSQDAFGQTAGALSGKTADLGGNWASNGDVTDFQASGSTAYNVTRTEVSDAANTGRYAQLGSGTYTNVTVETDATLSTLAATVHAGALARYTDASNWVMATIQTTSSVAYLVVRKRVAGTVTTLGSTTLSNFGAGERWSLSITVDSAGGWLATIPSGSGTLSGVDTDLATGGTLATGKTGIYDENTSATACTRTFDNFSTLVPPAVQVAAYAGQDLDFRGTDGDVIRESADGVTWGRPSTAVMPIVPKVGPAGRAGLTSRIVAMTSRNNPNLASDPYGDSFDLTVKHTPAYSLGRWE